MKVRRRRGRREREHSRDLANRVIKSVMILVPIFDWRQIRYESWKAISGQCIYPASMRTGVWIPNTNINAWQTLWPPAISVFRNQRQWIPRASWLISHPKSMSSAFSKRPCFNSHGRGQSRKTPTLTSGVHKHRFTCALTISKHNLWLDQGIDLYSLPQQEARFLVSLHCINEAYILTWTL